ncbi:SGNH/GDSL hydrolase family protein [Desulfurispora thermophila]|uniref:SGNH/GDSL hydrolase family protein n=1 Tax=Desulfurispora thermophila TaxID=265470 RepID=UPI000382A5FA|nr:GDSL-type esterase/lipase family protein [Desulfurispora thermophila]
MLTKLLAFGDSLTSGYIYPPQQAWAGLLAQKLGLELVCHSYNGLTTAEILSLVAQAPLPPGQLACLMGGSNDLAWAPGPDVFQQALGHIDRAVSLLRQGGLTVFLGIPTPVPPDAQFDRALQKWRDMLRAYGQEQRIPLLDFYACLSGPDKEQYFLDGLHPTLAGHRLMAEYAFGVVREYLAETTGANITP